MLPNDWTPLIGPTDGEGQLPELPKIPRKVFPIYDNYPISNGALTSMVASYTWYDDDGRFLVREESVGIMRMVFYGQRYPGFNHQFNKLEDPIGEIVLAFQTVTYEMKQAWIVQIGRWLKQLREIDPEARKRADALRGFTGRLEYLQLGKNRPTVGGKELEDYELYTHYGVVKWCKTRDNKDLTEHDTRAIFVHHYDMELDMKRPITLSERFADPQGEVIKKVILFAEKHKKFFKPVAEKVVDKYEQEVLKLGSRFSTDRASQGDPFSATTSSFAGLSIGATAPVSGQQNAPSSGQDNVMFRPFTQKERDRVNTLQSSDEKSRKAKAEAGAEAKATATALRERAIAEAKENKERKRRENAGAERRSQSPQSGRPIRRRTPPPPAGGPSKSWMDTVLH